MPMLMERSDRLRTVDRVRKTDRVWFDTIATRAGAISFNVPEAGNYQVIFMRVDVKDGEANTQLNREKPMITDLIGYGAKFHTPRTTEEWMKELREGEEE